MKRNGKEMSRGDAGLTSRSVVVLSSLVGEGRAHGLLRGRPLAAGGPARQWRTADHFPSARAGPPLHREAK